MKLQQLVFSSGLAIALATFSYVPAFAADAAVAISDSAAVTSKQAPTKKSVRVANRTFSRTVHNAILKTRGLEKTSITVFGNATTGRVTLAGQIESEDQDELAIEAAKKVQGVSSVSSNLTLHGQGGN